MLRLWGALEICRAISFVALLLPFVGAAAQASTADDVHKKIEELKAVLAAFDGKGSVASDVNSLRKLLLDKKLIGDGAADAFAQYSDEIQTLLKDKDSVLLVRTKAFSSATALATALATVFPDPPVEQKFQTGLETLTSIMTANLADQLRLEAALADADKSKPVPKARDAFDKAWALIEPDFQIHVLRSWFGDLRTDWDEGRLCTSTPAIKTVCEAKTECTPLQAGVAPAQFNQEILCGFDPAPLVDVRFKGVVVEYACVRGRKSAWNKVTQYPGTDPATGVAWAPRDINQVVLRSSAMGIRCPFPVKTGGG